MTLDILSDYIEKLEQHLAEELSLDLLIGELAEQLQPEQIAILLEAFPIKSRLIVWELLPSDCQKDVFLEMKNESRQMLLNVLSDDACYLLLDKLDASSLLDFTDDLSDRFVEYAVAQMTAKQREHFKAAQDYKDDEVGHWQTFNAKQIPQQIKVSAAKKLCSKSLPQLTETVYVTDSQSKLVGEIAINRLLSLDDDALLVDVINHDIQFLQASSDMDEAAEIVIMSGKSALPIVDDNGRLMGRLDLFSAFKHQEEERDNQLMQSAGLVEEEDLFASVWLSSKNRAIWLGINLITAFLASWFIGLFEATLQQVVALAVLMPVVASMGGISGSQTLTLIIRGLALGQITDANKKAIINKELKVGAINGILWALVIGIITYFWFESPMLSFTICIAILGNIIVASLSGVWVPWVLNKLNIDPALSGSVILTTVTDIFGFIAFLGCGTLFLL
ncbi:magnesium transporter [Thalassotalea profundi]|uniref:Magnesium transporter MgtE n=1 Tax=Thalassotalea profundi TaxID=2036687 RepID=A0ABQ3IIJ3_9GAMM|nr:magnesium transporter [Thalassotalea profundi]GHE85571.1 magnesium transporter MgtE [Thalassotalea profundi]